MNEFLGLFVFVGVTILATQSKNKISSYLIMCITSIIMFVLPVSIIGQGGVLTNQGILSAFLGFVGTIIYGIATVYQTWTTTKD